MRGLLVAALASLLPICSALECSKQDVLAKYKIDEYQITGMSTQNTPPSETIETWWFSICDEQDSKSVFPDQCNAKDVFCGVTSVALPAKDTMVTRVMDFTDSVAVEARELNGALNVRLTGAAWGPHTLNADITLLCEENGSGRLRESKWTDESNVNLLFSGPFGCLKENNGDKGGDNKDGGDSDKEPHDGDKDTPKPKGGAGLGSWLVWLFMYAIIFALVYLVVTSYMNTRNGSFNDFREEFVDRSTTFATNLPQFAKEVAGKIVNTGSSSQRGGYSAV